MNPDPIAIVSSSPETTERLGAALAALLPRGAVLALRGELAAGKTCLVRGLADGLAVRSGHESKTDFGVSSPTFTLVNQYGGPFPLYHIDLYRIGGAEELADLGYEDLFEPDGVSAIEWAERAGPLLPEQRIDITLEHVDEHTRRLTIRDFGVLPEIALAVLRDFENPGTRR